MTQHRVLSRSTTFSVVSVLSAALCLLSCGTTTTVSSSWQWADPAAFLAMDDVDDGQSSYVTLLHEERYLFLYGAKYKDYGRTEIHRHTVHKILSEAAFDTAEVSIDWPRQGALLHLDARTVSPDGTVTPVPEDQIFGLSVTTAASGDEWSDKWRDNEVRTFRFPRVDVGSLLELAYTIEVPNWYSDWSGTIAGPVPVKKYVAEIVVEPGAQPDLMVLNKRYPLKLVPSSDGMQHLLLEASDVPPVRDEAGAPELRANAPWWLYRTIAYRSPNNVWNMNASWDSVVRRVGKKALSKDGFTGLPALRDAASCSGDARCLMAKAWAQVRDAVAIDRTCSFFERRKVQEILDAGLGSSCDRALLLWALLDRAGLTVHIAGATRLHTLVPDRSFPSGQWLNQVFVVAKSGEDRIWLDPECDGCAPGELPLVADGRGAAPREAVVALTKGDEVEASWWPIRGAPSKVTSVQTELWTVRLRADGAAELELDERMSGSGTWSWRRDARLMTHKEHEKNARRRLRNFLPTAEMRAHEPVACEPTHCRRTVQGTAMNTAATDSDGLRLELRPLDRVWNLKQAERRTRPFVMREPHEWFTEVRVLPPAGMRIETLPPAKTLVDELVRVEINAHRDGDAVVVRRIVRMSAGTVPAERVEALRATLDAADLSARVMVVRPAG